MNVIVLAGGYASRLWPITRHRPKMFLPLGKTTVIDRLYAELERCDRIETVYVSTNERFAGDFEAHLAETAYDKPRLSIEATRAEAEKHGVVGGLARLVERESIDDDVLVVAADNVFDFTVDAFIEFFDRRRAPTVAAYDVGSTDRATDYGVLAVDDERVVEFVEKPDEPPGTLVSVGCYAFPRETLATLRTYLDSGNDPDEPGWFVEWLHPREPTYAFSFSGTWFDVGTRGSYLDAVDWHLDGGSLVADSASVENSSIGRGVHVMSNATLVDADVERAVVFPDATLSGTTVRRSIVDEGASLGDLDVVDAMVGAYTQLPGENTEA
ncbi:sugar phosphate nucleotidyltransferase [Halovivax cerinus]|uniref:Sugar phosphate nucleotidyltransferase n=1 Tax=Halovivax cerinus TaxID=1487865 RepID=A0ABD5NIX2_9EURY|nr:sugar phosphate nucleotidyltransferase [Halovivax cerinus]